MSYQIKKNYTTNHSLMKFNKSPIEIFDQTLLQNSGTFRVCFLKNGFLNKMLKIKLKISGMK